MDVEQRFGPAGRSCAPVAPLSELVVATELDAARLRRRFRAWIGALTDPDTADDLTLAVYEALANVVDHAYHDAAGPGPMRLWAAASAPLHPGREIAVTVSDRGIWRACSDPGWRGRGLPLVRSLCPSSDVLVTCAGTTVQMRQRIVSARRAVPA